MKSVRFLFAVLTLPGGCAPEDYRSYPVGDGAAPGGASLKVLVHRLAPAEPGERSPSPKAGHSSASQVHSLQYYVRAIAICEQLDVVGPAFSNPSGCLEIYRGEVRADLEYEDASADLSAHADAARENDEGFTDIMDSAGRSELSRTRPLTARDAGTYQWGVVTWYLPVLLKAEVPLAGATTLRTQDGDTLGYTDGNGYAYTTTARGSFADGGSPERAVVLHPTAGTWFRFHKPLAVTQQDIEDGAGFELDLAFDPEGMIKGYELDNKLDLRDSEGHGIEVGALDLAPVAHRAGEIVQVDSYRTTVRGEGSGIDPIVDTFDLRLDLYSVANDPEGAIHGAALTTLVNEATSTVVTTAPRAALVHRRPDGSLEIKDWSHTPILSGLALQQQVGDEAEAWLSCGETGIRFAGCGDHIESPRGMSVHFVLESVRTLP